MTEAQAPPVYSRKWLIIAHLFCAYQQLSGVLVYLWGKDILNRPIPPTTFVFMRLMFVIPIVFPMALASTRSLAAFKMKRNQWLFVLLSGTVGIFVTQLLLYTGLKMSTPTNASIISAPCTPIFTALFSVIRGTDKMNIYKGMGFLSSVAGALILLQVWNFEFKGTTAGNLLIVGSSICNALNSLIQKHLLNQGVPPLVVQGYACAIGLLTFAIGFSPFGMFDSEYWILPSGLWVRIAIIGIFLSALQWGLGTFALKITTPMTVNLYVVLQPPAAAFASIVILKREQLEARQVIGSALVLLGLLCVNAAPLLDKFFIRHCSKQKFVQLPGEEEEETGHEIEMKEVEEENEKMLEPDGASFSIGEENEVEYNLSTLKDTNEFVIEGEGNEEPSSQNNFVKPEVSVTV